MSCTDLISRVTRQDGRYFVVESPFAKSHLRTLFLRPTDMKGATVGDRVRLHYYVTPSSGLWAVAEVFPGPFVFTHCRICGEPVSDRMRRYAEREIADAHCGNTACTRRELLVRFACCEKAEPLGCVCAYAFRCPDHGDRHIGTHD